MTSLIPSSPSPQFRRHHDPPKLWLWILAGSLLFHLMAWATVRKFWATSAIQTDSTAIAVEFLEPIGKDAEVFSRQSESQPKESQPKDSRPQPPVEDDATQTTLSPPSISKGLPVKPVAKDSRIAPKQPVPKPSATIPPSTIQTQTTSSPKTIGLSAANSPPISSHPKHRSTPDAPMVDNSTKTPVVATSNVRLPGLPIIPNSTDAPVNQDPIGAMVPIASTPVKFMAQFRAIGSTSNPSNSSTESTRSAQLADEPTKLFSSDLSICALTPEALHSFGQPMRLKLPLTETGTLNSQKQVTVEQSSGNTQYDELAICVAKTSRFIPAYTLEGNTKRSVPSDLEMQVILTQ